MSNFKVSTCIQGLYENDNGKFTEHRPRSEPYGGGVVWRTTWDCCYRLVVYWTAIGRNDSQKKIESIKLFE